jgi:hypothetical protein
MSTLRLQSEISTGIRNELSKAAEHVEFKVASREREGAVWKVFVERSDREELDRVGWTSRSRHRERGGPPSRSAEWPTCSSALVMQCTLASVG